MSNTKVSVLSLRSLELVGVTTLSSGHSPMQGHHGRGVCGLQSAFAEDGVCMLALSSAGLSWPCWSFVICVDFDVLHVWPLMKMCWQERSTGGPSSAPGLRARLPSCPLTTRLPPRHKHTPTPKAAGLSRSDYY